MEKIPEKCINCPHSSVKIEHVHMGFERYRFETVTRCDLSGYKVGCVAAEVYCDRNEVDVKK
jgi:hypothetical protein